MYCSKCGTQLSDGANFCNNCGANVGNSIPPMTSVIEKSEDKSYNKVVSFMRNAPLFISGLIMSLLTWPIYLWFELKLRLAGSVYSVLKDYGDYYEMSVWNKAISASETLGVFCWIGVILLVLGIVLYIVEAKRIIRKSKLRNICLLVIPIIIMLVIAVCTYPAIFNYESTFSYIIY